MQKCRSGEVEKCRSAEVQKWRSGEVNKICWLHRVESVGEREGEKTRTKSSYETLKQSIPDFPAHPFTYVWLFIKLKDDSFLTRPNSLLTRPKPQAFRDSHCQIRSFLLRLRLRLISEIQLTKSRALSSL